VLRTLVKILLHLLTSDLLPIYFYHLNVNKGKERKGKKRKEKKRKEKKRKEKKRQMEIEMKKKLHSFQNSSLLNQNHK